MTSLAQAIRVLHDRAGDDTALAETVRYLAEVDDGPADPFSDPGPSVMTAAQRVNERRTRHATEARRDHLLDTSGVIDAIASINDRKGVDRRRRRGSLLGWREGRRTLHPDWQIDPGRGDTRPGLGRVLEALREVTDDAVTADALMTAPRPDLDGRALVDLLAAGRIDTVVRLVHSAGDQS
jgi:hypothetical protein